MQDDLGTKQNWDILDVNIGASNIITKIYVKLYHGMCRICMKMNN